MAQSGCLPVGSPLITVRRQSATRHRCGGSCPSAVRTTPSVRQGCSGHRQVGRRPLAVVHGLAFSKAGGEFEALQQSNVKRASPCASGRISAHQAKGVQACQGHASQQGKVCFSSSAVPSRPSLTYRSSRHLQAPLVGSLRASHSGAAYLGVEAVKKLSRFCLC